MELTTIRHLCRLSRLSYDDAALEKVMGEMSDIVSLMDTIKELDIDYDDTLDMGSISFSEVREDEAAPSSPTEKLLRNARSRENCFVVPKVVD
ncbi:MAG: Asp-tRNA(Asn)/Glu-tRNA(Gln) amidotransferase subunit GatC [Oscillospiraceae bacterium]|nr:Asp-tRNA(Asn)/Glu-tRNA(Gln) amidotransferase subunit GatC [Oscillospiraceae bacterium]